MIRRAHHGDLERIAWLFRASFEAALLPFMAYGQPGVPLALGRVLDHAELSGGRTLLVYTHQEEVVGFAEFKEAEPGAAFLSYLCVDPAARGAGVGTALLEHFTAGAPGLQRISLDVFRANQRAQAFYRKHGFIEEHQQAHWYVRDIGPDEGAPSKLEVLDLAQGMAAYDRYGFCEFRARWEGEDIRLGRIGPDVLRCFDPVSFADDRLLAACRRSFASLRRASVILPTESPTSAVRINSAVRMTLTLPSAKAVEPR